MLQIPELDGPSVIFGNIKHMPKYNTLPEEFQDWHRQRPHCEAISQWFAKGAKLIPPDTIEIEGARFKAKSGVDPEKALRAIKAVLGSWEPKHEHKIAACGYMLSEWFEHKPPST